VSNVSKLSVRRAVGEAVLVVLVAAFQLAGTYAAAKHQTGSRSLDAGSTVLLLAGPLSLPLRRRAPWLTIGVALAAAITYFGVGYPGGPVFASVVVCLIALYRDRVMENRERRGQEEKRRRADERLRIARELHDVLAHSTAVVSVRAGVALHLIDSHPEQVRPALEAIRDASAESLRELRMAVALLRADAGETPDADADAALAPQPGLARLDPLLANAGAAGVTVRRSVHGTEQPLPAEVDLAAYRVIQESLTNAIRHAGPGAVELDLRYRTDELVLQIDSHGRARVPAGSVPGSGLIGMRERVEALGGSVTAGPHGDGFRVLARLPYESVR
jgi:signal transduction histidine kinase